MDEKPLTEVPCPRCLKLAFADKIRPETVQRLPAGAWAPRSRTTGETLCLDCAAAEGLVRIAPGLSFEMARVAVGNDRQEQYRLPGCPMGLVLTGLMQPSKPGDLEDQYDWLERAGILS